MNNSSMEKQTILQEVKKNIVFYTIVFWISGSIIFLISERFRQFLRLKKSKKYMNNTDLITNLSNQLISNSTSIITNENRMEDLEHKMNSFDPTPSYFYLDSGIIELMYSIREFSDYSEPIFKNIIRLLDKFLKLTVFADKHEAYLYDNLHDVKIEILNNLEQMIFNIPENHAVENKLFNAIRSMRYILNHHLEKIRLEYNESFNRRGPNIHNKYLQNDKLQGYNLSNSRHTNLQMH